MKGKLNCPVISEEKQNNSYKSRGQSEVKLQQQPKVPHFNFLFFETPNFQEFLIFLK